MSTHTDRCIHIGIDIHVYCRVMHEKEKNIHITYSCEWAGMGHPQMWGKQQQQQCLENTPVRREKERTRKENKKRKAEEKRV